MLVHVFVIVLPPAETTKTPTRIGRRRGRSSEGHPKAKGRVKDSDETTDPNRSRGHGDLAGPSGPVKGPEEAGLDLRGSDDEVRLHAGDGARQ